MRSTLFLLAVTVLAGCSSQTGGQDASPSPPAAPVTQTAAPMPAMPADSSHSAPAAATGVVTAIEVPARKITIAHGPVPALQWPAMTMGFSTGDVDLTGITVGDNVAFEFTAEGMNATITQIKRP